MSNKTSITDIHKTLVERFSGKWRGEVEYRLGAELRIVQFVGVTSHDCQVLMDTFVNTLLETGN